MQRTIASQNCSSLIRRVPELAAERRNHLPTGHCETLMEPEEAAATKGHCMLHQIHNSGNPGEKGTRKGAAETLGSNPKGHFIRGGLS
jgi:hypothetical protein